MKTTKHIFALAIVLCCTVGNLFAVEKSYYNSLDGKSGTALREALTNIVYTHHTTDVGYNWNFDGIDIVNGEVLDIYSSCTWTSSQEGKNYSGVCDAYNREHIVPQNVFNEKLPQKSDRHHLFLADGKVNNLRSSYPFGETNVTTAFSGYSNSDKALGKLGASSSGFSGTVYEPDNEYKGDIARAIMYMVIRYATADVCKKYGGTANSYPVTTWSNAMFSGSLSTNYGLSANAVAMYMKWHRADPPSAKEIARNNGVEAKQGNRNPFVDLPDLAEYLWGTHKTDAVNLSSLTLSTGGGAVPTPYEITLNRNGSVQTVTCTGTYTLPTTDDENDACSGWTFRGWTTASSVNSTTAPTYTTSVTAATTLYAVYGNTSSSAPIQKTGETITWDLVTDASTLKSGDVLVIASNASGATAGNISSQIMESISSTFSSGDNYATITSLGSSTVELTLGGSAGSWTLSNSSSQLMGATAAKKLAWGSGTTTWSISISSGAATIQNGTDSYGRFLYNKDNPRFTTYTSDASTTMLLPQLYRKTTSSSGSSTTYKTSPDCGTAHTITLNNDGSTTGGDFWANASSAYSGATVTLSAEPSAGYSFDSWTVTKQGGGSVTVTDNQFTMPDVNVTISASFTENPKHTITFYINGTQASQQSVSEGSVPNVPEVPECEGYTFVGWWTSSLGTSNTTSHTWVSDFTVGDANQNYYAIYSKSESGSGSNESITFSNIFSADTIVENKKISIGTHTSVTFTKRSEGTDTKYYASGTSIRWYGGGTCLIESDEGNITNITFTFGSSDGSNTISATGYTAPTWEGNASSVTFTQSGTSGNRRIAGIAVTIGGGSTTYYTSTTNCTAPCTGTLATPVVTATPGDNTITLTWAAVTDADHYTVTVSKGVGYTTDCGNEPIIGNITGTTTKQCIITDLTNGLEYTTTVVANATSSACDSEADEDTATPMDCNPWDDPTISWNKYSLNTTDDKTAIVNVSGTTHGTITFEPSNTEVLTVASNGTVTAVAPGTATVTAHWSAAGGYCEKSIISETFAISGPLTISFDANGGTGTMNDQTVTYNVAATLNANTFSRTGYTFQGWATSADGEKEYNNGASVTFTEATTLFAVWQVNSHNVTFTPAPTSATVTINGNSNSPQSVEYGTTVTIAITPADHYSVSGVTVTGATSGSLAITGTGDIRTFTMPDENVTVTVTMATESQYTASFVNIGEVFGIAQTAYADDDITDPGTPTAVCEGYTFVGWVSAQQAEETTVSPSVVTFPQSMPTGDITYYALYSRTEGGSGDAFDGVNSGTYKIYAQVGDDKYYAKGTGSKISSTTNESEATEYTFEALVGGGLAIKTGTTYITYSSSTNLGTAANAYTWTFESGTKGTWRVKSGTSGRALIFRAGSTNQFGGYSTSNITAAGEYYDLEIGGEGGTSYYTTSPNCYVCENHIVLTKGTAEHGTFNLSKANGTYDNCKTNFIVSVTDIEPAEGYYCTGITVTGEHHKITGPNSNGDYTVIYVIDNNVSSTITANFEKLPFTIGFYDNGSLIGTEQQVLYGDSPEIPANPEPACNAYTFVGWWTETLSADNTTTHSWISNFTVTQDQNYYAIYSKTVSGGSVTWSQVTSVSAGDEVVIAQVDDGTQEMTGFNTTTTTANNYGTGASFSTNPAGTMVWTVESGNSTGSFSFKNGSYYLRAPSTSNNYLYGESDKSNYSSWTIATSSERAQMTNVGADTRVLMWNKSSTRFSTYAGKSHGNNNGSYYYYVIFYKKSGGSTTYYTSTLNCTATEFEQVETTEKAIKVLENGMIVIIRGKEKYTIFGQKIQ